VESESFYLFNDQLAYYIYGMGIGEGYTAQSLLQKINMGQCSIKKINPDTVLFLLLENKEFTKEEVEGKLAAQNPKLIIQAYRNQNLNKNAGLLPEPPLPPPPPPEPSRRTPQWPIILGVLLLSSEVIILSIFSYYRHKK